MSGALALAGVTATEVFAGPAGWFILGGTILIGGAALYHAHQQSQSDLSDKPQDQVCADCGEVGCFNTPEGGDPDEMDRQLK